jgi:hypothetical protein
VLCPQCQFDNRASVSFCEECGTKLDLACQSCGAAVPAGRKFCGTCGNPLIGQPTSAARFSSPEAYTTKHLAERIVTSKAALEGVRKQVTVLFADLKGSMELLADHDPAEAGRGQSESLTRTRRHLTGRRPVQKFRGFSGPLGWTPRRIVQSP